MAEPLLLLIPGLGYLLAAVLLLLRPAEAGGPRWRSSLGGVAPVVIGLCLALHLGLLGLRLHGALSAPFTSAREFAVLLSLLLVLAYLLTARLLRGVGVAEVVLALAGLALIAVAPSLPLRPTPAPDVLGSPWLLLHVPLCLLAYLMYALAGSAGAMYLLVSGLLKARRPLALSRNLPTLESLERFAERAARLGFPLLTAAIITGMVWSHAAWGQLLPESPKQLLALAAWGVYAAYLHVRLARRSRGRFCAWLLVVGLALTIAGTLVPLVTHGPHRFL